MSGLRYGKITPTDIDGFLDFGGKLFVFIEHKRKPNLMERGQEWALERLADGYNYAGRKAIAIFCWFTAQEINRKDEIIVHACSVMKYRRRDTWEEPKTPITVKQAVDNELRRIGLSAYLIDTASDSQIQDKAEYITCPGEQCSQRIRIVDGKGWCPNHQMKITYVQEEKPPASN